MLAAWEIVRYFIDHATAALTDGDLSTEDEDARGLYRRILESGGTAFTKTMLYKVTNYHMPKARLENALAALLEDQRIMVENELEDDRNRRYILPGEKQHVDESELC